MIIKINQISYASDPEYDIEGFERVYQANAGFYSKYQSVTVRASDCLYEARFDPAGVGSYIPLSYLFGKEKVTRRFCLYKDDCAYGSVALVKTGWFREFYRIQLDGGETLICYSRLKGSFEYISIYLGEKQVALVEILLSNVGHKYRHKLYLLDECAQFAETLVLFVIYHSSFTYAKRGEFCGHSESVYAFSFSGFNNKYDPQWREKNFPDENFFGKTSLL